MRKLLKYDLRSMIKQFAIIWPAVLLLALINGFLLVRPNVDLGTAVGTMVYGVVLTAAFVITAVFVIGRFYSGLLKDEGYLMFTLPVTPARLIFSKLITAVIAVCISSIVAFVSVLLLAAPELSWTELISDFWSVFPELNRLMPMWPLLLVEFIVLGLVYVASMILEIYMCIAIGHLARRRRIPLAIVAYVVISSVSTALFFRLCTLVGHTGIDEFITGMTLRGEYFQSYALVMLFFIAVQLLFAAVYFIVTNFILSRRLNLE